MPSPPPGVPPGDTARAALLEELLGLAVAAADAAAALLLDAMDRVRLDVGTKSSRTDMVTEMDRASEALVRDLVLGARPDDGFLGEESDESTGTSGVRWVVDPLDGTTNYLYGHAGWNVAVAAELDGRGVVGVVHDPLQGDVFAARLGGGATRNGRTIAVSEQRQLATALCATGFAYDPDRRRRQAEVLAAVIPQIRDVRRVGAAAVDICSVACGRLDAYWERGLGPWDLAAGAVIATEAGAVVGDPDELGYVLVAPPALFEALRRLLDVAGAATA